jgi:LmbE family N-acetylglucosaminyl deacetylase
LALVPDDRIDLTDGDRMMVVVAHPDDETFGCGSLLLYAVARGAVTAVVCATRGEAGKPAPGSGIDVADLPAVREAELRHAADMLGVSRVDLLDLLDSDMAGDPAPGTLCATPLEDVRDQIVKCFEHFKPTVVVTLEGTDGHRDHIHMRDATIAAVGLGAAPVRDLYLYSLPKSVLQKWIDHMGNDNPDWEHLELGIPGTPDDEIDIVIDTPEHFELREKAIAAHRSQVSPFADLPEALRREFLTREPLRRVRKAIADPEG